jgi:glycosyltransferase involved in cell wall biosynthesis
MVKVIHLNYFKVGGAAKIANVINNNLKNFGWDSKFSYISRRSLNQDYYKHLIRTCLVMIDKYMVNKNKDHNFVSLFRNYNFRNSLDIEIKKADIIHLHWINGMIDIKKLSKIIKSHQKVFWTLHDSFPLTGGCHLLNECTEFKNNCAKCPIVRSIFRPLVKKQFESKADALKRLKNLTIIFPSTFMQEKFQKACIEKNLNSEIYLNHDVGVLESLKKSSIRQSGLKDTINIGFSALDFNDKNKNLNSLLDAIESVQTKNKNIKIKLCLFGYGKLKKRYSFEIKKFGYIDQPEEKTKYMGFCDIWAVTSIFESFNLGAMEAAVLGIPIISSNVGFAREFILDQVNGMRYQDHNQLVLKLEALVLSHTLREQMSYAMLKNLNKIYGKQKNIIEFYQNA